jgi:hypothetical protein
MRSNGDAADLAVTPAQVLAMNALLSGSEVDAAADAGGVEAETLRGWLADHHAFLARMNLAKRERADRVRAEVRGLALNAAATLRELLTSAESPPAVRLRVALAIVGAAGAIEAEKIGPTTARGVNSAMEHCRFIESLGG